MAAAGLITQLHPRTNARRDWQMFVAGVRHKFDELLWSPRPMNPCWRLRMERIWNDVQGSANDESTRRGTQA